MALIVREPPHVHTFTYEIRYLTDDINRLTASTCTYFYLWDSVSDRCHQV